MKRIVLVSAVAVQCALLAVLIFRSADVAAIALAVIALLCLIALLFKREKETGVVAPVEPGGNTVEAKHEPELPPQRVEKDAVAEEPSYFERYLSYLADVLKRPDAAARTRADVEALLGSTNDGSEGRVNEILLKSSQTPVKGLVVGRVQSGKTQNYIGLMLKAIDEGFNVIVVLTSKSNELVRQTRNRIFGGDGEEGAFEVVKYADFVENRFFEGDGESCYDILEQGKAFVGIAQKEQLKDGGHLPRIAKWFEEAGEYRGEMKVLIIDDEADYASQNSLAGSSVWGLSDVQALVSKIRRDVESEEIRKFLSAWIRTIVSLPPGFDSQQKTNIDSLRTVLGMPNTAPYDAILRSKSYSDLRMMLYLDNDAKIKAVDDFFTNHSTKSALQNLLKYVYLERERSTINKSIVEMCGAGCAQMLYVGYTATPFANLINESPKDNPLYPAFVQSLSMSPEYFGFDRIFGSDKNSDVARLDIVRDIPAAESDDDSVAVTPTLKDAITWAFCSAAARLTVHSGEKKERTTMLINIDREKGQHKKIKDAVISYIAGQVTSLDGFVKACKEVWTREVERFNLEKFRMSAPDWPAEVRVRDWTLADWPHIEQGIRYFFGAHDRINVVVLNSDAANTEDSKHYQQGVEERDSLWIVCGGDAIARGLTLEGLTVSYYDRVSENSSGKTTTCVDTMSQMGRWFGYRNGYQLLPRIWMPKGALNLMKGACYTENRLHDEIRKAFDAGVDVSDPNHYLPLSICSQRLTGRDAAASHIAAFRLSDVVVQLSRVRQDMEGAWAVLKEYVAKLGPQTVRTAPEYPYARFPYWKRVQGEVVSAFLSAVSSYVPKQTKIILSELNRIVNANKELEWDVVVADVDSGLEPYDIGGGVRVRPSGAKEDAVDGDVVEFRRKTQDYLAYLAGYKEKNLATIDAAVEKKFGEKLRRGARAEYRDMAYVVMGDCRPKLQLFLVRPSDAVSVDKSIPLIKYAFEWPGSDRAEEYAHCVLGDNEWLRENVPDENKSAEPVAVVMTDRLAEALKQLREAACPWYKWKDIYDTLRKGGIKSNISRFVVKDFLKANGWVMQETDQGNGEVWAHKDFCGASENPREKARLVVAEFLEGLNEEQLHNSAEIIGAWNAKHAESGSAWKSKVDRVVNYADVSGRNRVWIAFS